MSTYAWIHGVITLDAPAAKAFKTSDSWHWCSPEGREAAENNDIGAVSVAKHGNRGLVLDFGGSDYRNLCRYVAVDLARAAQAGTVEGLLTIDCSDGCHSRQVVEYSPDQVWTGDGECFRMPVAAGPANILRLGSTDIFILVSNDQLTAAARASTPLDIEPVVASKILVGAEAPYDCGCGGYDEQDFPVCATMTAV